MQVSLAVVNAFSPHPRTPIPDPAGAGELLKVRRPKSFPPRYQHQHQAVERQQQNQKRQASFLALRVEALANLLSAAVAARDLHLARALPPQQHQPKTGSDLAIMSTRHSAPSPPAHPAPLNIADGTPPAPPRCLPALFWPRDQGSLRRQCRDRSNSVQERGEAGKVGKGNSGRVYGGAYRCCRCG